MNHDDFLDPDDDGFEFDTGTSTRSALRSVGGMLPSLSAFVIGLVVVIIIIGIGFGIAGYFHRETHDAVVFDKERVCSSDSNGDRSCKYLIYTDRGTYELTDSIAIGRFTSSDAYGRIRRCHRYSIESYGFRFGLTSSYPNIVKATDLGHADGCTE